MQRRLKDKILHLLQRKFKLHLPKKRLPGGKTLVRAKLIYLLREGPRKEVQHKKDPPKLQGADLTQGHNSQIRLNKMKLRPQCNNNSIHNSCHINKQMHLLSHCSSPHYNINNLYQQVIRFPRAYQQIFPCRCHKGSQV